MEPRAATITDLVCRVMRVPGEDRASLLAACRRPEARLAPTLLSLYARDGVPCSPSELAELEQYRNRRNRHRALLDDLLSLNTSLYQMKGFEQEAFYPRGVLRDANDLDLVVRTDDNFRTVAGRLLELGFWIEKLGISQTEDGRYAYYVVFRRTPNQPPPDDPWSHAYSDKVELANYVLVGNKGTVRPQLDHFDKSLPRPVKNLLAVMAERFEQRYRVRDLLDASLSLAHFDENMRAELSDAVYRYRLSLECVDLVRRMRNAGLPAAEFLALDAARVAQERARRTAVKARTLLSVRRTLSVLARRYPGGRLVRAMEWADRIGLVPRNDVPLALRHGLRAAGMPVEPDSVSRTTLLHDRAHALTYALTPAGRYVLTSRGYLPAGAPGPR